MELIDIGANLTQKSFRHDLDKVLALFSDEAVFETWTGIRIEGRENIRKAWMSERIESLKMVMRQENSQDTMDGKDRPCSGQ